MLCCQRRVQKAVNVSDTLASRDALLNGSALMLSDSSVLAPESGAAPLGGNNLTDEYPNVDVKSRWDYHVADDTTPIDFDGTVTAWQAKVVERFPIQLVIYRKGAAWSVVGKSQLERPPQLGINVFPLATPISVKKGDLVGFYSQHFGPVPYKIYRLPDGAADASKRSWHTIYNQGDVGFTEHSHRVQTYAIGVIGHKASDGPQEGAGPCGICFNGGSCDSDSKKCACVDNYSGPNCRTPPGLLSGGNNPEYFGDHDNIGITKPTNYYLVDENIPVDFDGIVTEWQVHARMTGTIQLVMYRRIKNPNSANTWIVVGKSALEAAQLGLNTFRLSEPIPVKKGDYVGMHVPGKWGLVCATSNQWGASRVTASNMAATSFKNDVHAERFIHSIRVSGQRQTVP